MAKNATVEAEVPKIVTTQSIYRVVIGGPNLLMNALPDLSTPKASLKDQTNMDPIEKEHLTWREKAYFSGALGIYIPGENIHESLKEGAKYWGAKIAGEGQKTYTDIFKSAVVVEDAPLGIPSRDDDRLVPYGKNCNGIPSKGKQSGSRVYKIRPIIHDFKAEFRIHVFDRRINRDVLLTVLTTAGMFKGLCDWRPTYGRFTVLSLEQEGGDE